MRVAVRIKLDLLLYRRFASLCKFLGIRISDTLEQFMQKFIEEHKDQLPLDLYLNQTNGKTQIINFNFTQNYNLVLAKIAKIDPEGWLKRIEDLEPDLPEIMDNEIQRDFWVKQLSDLILEASKTIEELKAAGEYDYIESLQELIEKASEILRKLLKKKKTRRELIHA